MPRKKKVIDYDDPAENTVDAFLRGKSDEEKEALFRIARAELARTLDDAEGFGHFFWSIFGKELPEHAKDWVEKIYAAKSRGKGSLREAFRGSAKTTVVTMGFTLFRIGHDPSKANLLVQVGDDTAQITSGQMADIIEHNPGWRQCFPYIVPDKELGWSGSGYEVKNLKMDYAAWRKLNAGRKDPTLMGLGYRSASLIGKRPDGVLIIDDINDIGNTESVKENDATIRVLTSTIFPARTPDTWTVFIGTPWTEKDVLSYIKATGEFECHKTPVFDRDGNSIWPERFTNESIESQRKVSGSIEFARMYQLDLTQAAGTHLKREWLHYYPHDKIMSSWPCYFGVDYASTQDKLQSAHKKNDSVAIAYGRVIPGGGIVLEDGFVGILSQGEAEQKLKAMAHVFSPPLIGMEAIGKGEEFYYLMLNTTNLPLMPYKSSKSKGDKFEKQMAPLFEMSRVWISDVETPFLQRFKDEWLSWPNGEHDDTLDAVYYLCRTAVAHLMVEPEGEELRKKQKVSQAAWMFGRL